MFKFISKFVNSRQLYLKSQEKSKEPWSCFEVVGFENDGRIKVEFNWNKPFIEAINKMGFQAETEEDTVQLFFYASQMKPTDVSFAEEDEQAKSAAHPNLMNDINRMVK
jgi:hypothetical protein